MGSLGLSRLANGLNTLRPAVASKLLERVLPNAARLLSSSTSQGSASSSLTSSSTSEVQLSALVKEGFQRDAMDASEQIAETLTPEQRATLAAALAKHHKPEHIDDKYLEALWEAVDNQSPKGVLTRTEFQQALVAHHTLIGSTNVKAPDSRALMLVFLAGAIPFCGFGFLDNAIMIVAGEEIDAVFGVRLGLSTLASAGLGNMVADVVGVGAANAIESSVKKLPLMRNLKLSKQQMSMRSARTARALGATIGVACGCLLGLMPLVVTDTFFVPDRGL